jgi:hypothetical protein
MRWPLAASSLQAKDMTSTTAVIVNSFVCKSKRQCVLRVEERRWLTKQKQDYGAPDVSSTTAFGSDTHLLLGWWASLNRRLLLA